MPEFGFIATLAIRLLKACPACKGDILYVVGVSYNWICLGCGIRVDAEVLENDPRLDVFKETLSKLDLTGT